MVAAIWDKFKDHPLTALGSESDRDWELQDYQTEVVLRVSVHTEDTLYQQPSPDQGGDCRAVVWVEI